MGGKKSTLRNPRVLLMGTASSGKSTFVAQMRRIQCRDLGNTDRENFHSNFRKIIVMGLNELVQNADRQGYPIEKENRKRASYFLGLQAESYLFNWTKELISEIKALWDDKAIQTTWKKHGCSLAPAIDYMIEILDRSQNPSFGFPLEEDIVRTPQPTFGIHITKLSFYKEEWSLIDMGGIETERKNWEKATERGCHAIMFFVSMDEFNMTSANIPPGKSKKTKLMESYEAWKDVVTSGYAQKSGIVLFLNKADLLENKLKQKDSRKEFRQCFPDWKGGEFDINGAASTIRDYFLRAVPDTIPVDQIEVIVTCGLDQKLMGKVFNLLMEHVIVSRINFNSSK